MSLFTNLRSSGFLIAAKTMRATASTTNAIGGACRSSPLSSSSSSSVPLSSKTIATTTTATLLQQSGRLSYGCRFMGTKALIKTNKSAAKRFRVRGSGSVKRAKGGNQHNKGYKSRTNSNQLGQGTGIREPKIEKRMRRLIGK